MINIVDILGYGVAWYSVVWYGICKYMRHELYEIIYKNCFI